MKKNRLLRRLSGCEYRALNLSPGGCTVSESAESQCGHNIMCHGENGPRGSWSHTCHAESIYHRSYGKFLAGEGHVLIYVRLFA